MKMKKRLSGFLVVLLSLSILFSAVAVFAEESISQRSVTPVVSDPTDGNDVQEADPSRYENEELKSLVTELNNGAAISPADMIGKIMQRDGKTNPEAFQTTTGETINLKLYDAASPVMDLVNTKNGTETMNGTPGLVTVQVPTLVGQEGSDLLVMQFNSKTGEIYLVTLSEFDSETGELKANFPCYGPFIVISKVPLVTKVVAPEKYPNKDVANIVESCSITDYLSFSTWMEKQGIKDSTFTFEVPTEKVTQTSQAEGVVYAAEKENTTSITVNVRDYEAVTLLSDVAVRTGVQNYGYNLSTRIKARLYQDIDRANWTRVLNYAGIKYDLEAMKKNPELLKEIEPFVLEKAFVYHIDAATGKVSVVYEPTISFDTYDEQTGNEIEIQDNQDAQQTSSIFKGHQVYAEMKPVDKSSITWFNVDDIDEDNKANMNMVIAGDGYLGLGPYLLLLPKTNPGAASNWWIWLIVALVVAGVVTYVVVKNKKKKQA